LNKEAASINGDGHTGRDFTFVENVVQANIRALFCPLKKHEVANVAFGNMTTLNDLWKMISSGLGVSISAKHGPDRTGDIKHSLASIERARTLFGYEPEIGVEEGLQKTLSWAKLQDRQPG
jgi:UDP-N-acetylglucosamine 4-epimerase